MSALRRAEDAAIYAAAQAVTLNQALCALSMGLRAGREPSAMLALVDATAAEVVASIAALDGALDTFVAVGGLDEPPEYEPASWALTPGLPAARGGVEQGGDSVSQNVDLVLEPSDRDASVVAIDGDGREVETGVAHDRVELGAQLPGVDHESSPSVRGVGDGTPATGDRIVGGAPDSPADSFGGGSAGAGLVGDDGPLSSPTSTGRSAS